MKRFFCLVALFLLLSLPVAGATPTAWFDKEFDFSKVKTVYVNDPKIASNVSYVGEAEGAELFWKNFQPKTVTLLDVNQVLAAHQKKSGVDLLKLHETNPDESYRQFVKAVSEQSDLAMYTELGRDEKGRETVEFTLNDPKTGRTVAALVESVSSKKELTAVIVSFAQAFSEKLTGK